MEWKETYPTEMLSNLRISKASKHKRVHALIATKEKAFWWVVLMEPYRYLIARGQTSFIDLKYTSKTLIKKTMK